MQDLTRRNFLATVGLLTLGALGCNTSPGKLSEGAVPITQSKWGEIPIEFEDIEFPLSWIYSMTPEFSLVPWQERPGKLGELEKEMSLHQVGFLEKYIRRAYVPGSLFVNGNEWGGTRTLDGDIYVVYPEVFHGEFSSLLYLDPSQEFPSEQWRAINPPDFTYIGYDQTHPLPGGDAHFADPNLLAQGFISPYSQWTEEEDFNLYFEKFFAHPGQLLAAAQIYPRVAEKVKLTTDFYNLVSGKNLDAREIAKARVKNRMSASNARGYLPGIPSLLKQAAIEGRG